jgi:hypothetical protein
VCCGAEGDGGLLWVHDEVVGERVDEPRDVEQLGAARGVSVFEKVPHVVRKGVQ